MSRNALLVRLLAAVGAIAAIALAAATLETPIDPDSGGSGGFGNDGGDPAVQPPPAEQPGPGGTEIPAVLEYLFYAIVIVLAIAFVWYLIAHRRDAVRLIAVVLVLALIGMGLLMLLEGAVPEPEPATPPEPANQTGGGGDGIGDGDGESFSTTPLLMLLAVLTVIFVGALLVSRSSGEPDPGSPAPPTADVSDDQSDAAAVASAAGRAADRLDDADDREVDNEIYRAWGEMTDPLEVSRPETSTPREFAGAAVDAGLEREHVDELTRLFEDVRYGHAETTPEMESRAVEVLRRIEETYATDGDTGQPSTDDDTGANRGGRR